MARPRHEGLTPRESQIMDVIWRKGEASVEEVQQDLTDRLADSTVRKLLGIMRDKGYVSFRKESKAKVYRANITRKEAQKSAIRYLIRRLFQDSADLLLARLVEEEEIDLEELDRLRRQLEQRQKEKRG
jgi:predicted transcriptional regulator